VPYHVIYDRRSRYSEAEAAVERNRSSNPEAHTHYSRELVVGDLNISVDSHYRAEVVPGCNSDHEEVSNLRREAVVAGLADNDYLLEAVG